MKKIVSFANFVLAVLFVLGSAQAQNNIRSKGICPWPGNLDGVKVAPETHKVIFENEHVRVLEVTIPRHSKEPVHTHCLPSTLYFQQIGERLGLEHKSSKGRVDVLVVDHIDPLTEN